MTKTYPKLLVFNDPYVMRINRELADEIGLPESVVLVQLAYRIERWGELRDDRLWLRIKQEKLRADFPWWAAATLCRILKRLRDIHLIDIANFNKHTHDRTRWYALDPTGIGSLKSVRLFQNESSPAENTAENAGASSNLENATDQIDLSVFPNLEVAITQTDNMLKGKKNHHLKNHVKESTITTDNSGSGGDGGSPGVELGEVGTPQERTPLEIWLDETVGLVTAHQFRDWPEGPTRARVLRLLDGIANPAMIVAELRNKKHLIFAQAATEAANAPSADSAPICPAWIVPTDWLQLTAVQRDAYAESQLNADGAVAGRYPELDEVINVRFKVTTERLIQATRGAA
ncbi:MAG: hypothetical protein H0T53_10890 [Herpetosiphonaceae bacterium]|nr:hypothetical protein [Herpetosiphonaceae bacterium]